MTVDQIIIRKLDFIDKTFIKKNNSFYFRQSLWGSQGEESKVNIAINQKNFRRERVIVWQRHCKDFSCHSVRFLKKDYFLNKIFHKIKQHFISNKVYRDFKANKARWISPMTKKALGANELLCDNHNNQAERHVFLTLKNDLFMIEHVWFTIRFDIL